MKLTYISILRSLSILVVVFFHVYQYMYVPAHFPETVQMYTAVPFRNHRA